MHVDSQASDSHPSAQVKICDLRRRITPQGAFDKYNPRFN